MEDQVLKALSMGIILLETDYALKSFVEGLPAAGQRSGFKTYVGVRGGYFFITLGLMGLFYHWVPELLLVALTATLAASLDLPVGMLQQRLFGRFGIRCRPLQVLQVAGLAVVAWVSAKLIPLVPSGTVTAFWSWLHSLPMGKSLRPDILIWESAGLIFLIHPVNYLIRWLIDKQEDNFLVEEAAEALTAKRVQAAKECAAASETALPERAATLRAGRVIGILERLILVLLVSRSQFGALGLVLAAKSMARFKEIEQNPSFAEYYLLGTLYSTLAALVVGLMLAAL